VTIVHGSRFDPEPLTRALQNEPIQVETHKNDCLIAATDQIAGEVRKPDTLGLVLTTYPAAALCLANRLQGTRAVLAADPGTVAADAASVGANVLVVDPRTAGFFQMKLILSRFCGEGPRVCPEVFRGRLE
jgi:ribose 5-phosphate isomerase RpiB